MKRARDARSAEFPLVNETKGAWQPRGAFLADFTAAIKASRVNETLSLSPRPRMSERANCFPFLRKVNGHRAARDFALLRGVHRRASDARTAHGHPRDFRVPLRNGGLICRPIDLSGHRRRSIGFFHGAGAAFSSLLDGYRPKWTNYLST